MMTELETCLTNMVERLHHILSLENDSEWPLIYCDLQFVPLLLDNLERRGIFTRQSLLEYDLLRCLCNDIRAAFSNDYLKRYYEVIHSKYQKFQDASKSRELIQELSIYWLHLYALCYLVAETQPEIDHSLLRQSIEKLDCFVFEQCRILPRGWLELAAFFISRYCRHYSFDLPRRTGVREIDIEVLEFYRLTHLILLNTDYLKEPLSAGHADIFRELIECLPLHCDKFGKNIDALSELFLILRTSSSYGDKNFGPQLPDATSAQLRELEIEYQKNLHAELIQLERATMPKREKYHSYVTLILYLLTIPKTRWVTADDGCCSN